jgi:DNA-binding transcriptional regulator YdaS (Cro superfamily)
MTELLEQAIEAVRQLPPERQDSIARAILTLSTEEIDPEHLPYVLQGLAETQRREFVPDTEAVLRRFVGG